MVLVKASMTVVRDRGLLAQHIGDTYDSDGNLLFARMNPGTA